MATRQFTRQELDDLDLPYEFEETQFIGEHRWYDARLGIFEVDGVKYGIEYCDPKTEMQEDLDPWNESAEVTAYEVEKVPVTAYEWRSKAS